MGRPKEHGEATQRALVDAAVKLLETEGAAGLSVRRVADIVGVSTRAVYSVFGSKEAMFNALYAESMERLRDRLAALPLTDDPVEDLITAALLGFRRYSLEDENLFRLAFERLVPDFNPSKEDLRVGLAPFNELKRRVARCASAGLLGGRDVSVVSMQFHAICQGLASTEMLGWFARYGDPEEIWRQTLSAFVHGVAATDVVR